MTVPTLRRAALPKARRSCWARCYASTQKPTGAILFRPITPLSDLTQTPTDDRESAILTTLSPGTYTAILTGKDEGTGIGLVETYNLSP